MEGREDNLLEKLKDEKDWNNSVIFTSSGEIIADNGASLQEDEINFYIKSFDDRDTTVGNGFFVNDVHFDVHRFHPPLIYGRRGGPEDGEGIALARVVPSTPKDSEEYWYILITYLLPILSAKAVPQMVDFSNNYLGENK
mmetsp:Transcript_7061/g.7928  ORF Transcript_7061/g.7928 Transcript_7061/m.7928 type:complete len:140 (+) Transcript_7061:32-451(+)